MNRFFRKKVWVAALATAAAIVTIGSARVEGEEAKGTFGTYEPNSGFRVASTEKGELNLRIYTYIRYLNQKGLDLTYTDSFGDTSTIDTRQDIQLQKMTINFQGWLMSSKFRYLAYVWTSNTSQGLGAQVVVAGNVNYAFSPYITVGGGIDALPGVRALEGNFPF